MKTHQWISILKTLKTIALLIWIMAFFANKLGWFQHSETISAETLKNLERIGILCYLLLYLLELRLTVKHKDIEIAKLKTKLLKYDNE